jgi:drug/metabolite transporter (DMT)-like permease
MKLSLSKNARRFLGYLFSLGVALLLGSAPTAIKEVIANLSPAGLLFMRCTIAAIIFTPFTRNLNTKLIRDGAILGLLLFSIYATEAIGLLTTSANRASFIFGLNIVFVMLFEFLLSKRLSTRIATTCLLAFGGIGLIILESGEPLTGNFWLLTCAFIDATQIVALGVFAPRHPPASLAAIQFWVIALLSLLWAAPALTEQFEVVKAHPETLGYIAYMGIACSALSILLQTIAQRWIPSHEAAIFSGTEPVFGAIFAFLFLGESFGIVGFVGAAMVLAGVARILRGEEQREKVG